MTLFTQICAVCTIEFVRRYKQMCCSKSCAMKIRPKQFTHGGARTPEFRAFQNAKYRCNNPKSAAWPQYGGRGIEFRFQNFEEFLAEVGCRPNSSFSIDRINNNGHYEPGNVRWATRLEQQQNRRKTKLLTIKDQSHSISEWARRIGMPHSRLNARISNGWCKLCAVSKPLQGTCSHRERQVTI